MTESETKIQYIDRSTGDLVIKFYSRLSIADIIEVYGDRPLSYFLEQTEELED